MARLVLGAIVLVLVVTLVLVRAQETGLLLAKGPSRILNNQPNPEGFGQCLTKARTVLYVGADEASDRQKELLSSSLPAIDMVDCTRHTKLCQDRGVNTFPAWELAGNRYVGVLPVGTIADISGCSY